MRRTAACANLADLAAPIFMSASAASDGAAGNGSGGANGTTTSVWDKELLSAYLVGPSRGAPLLEGLSGANGGSSSSLGGLVAGASIGGADDDDLFEEAGEKNDTQRTDAIRRRRRRVRAVRGSAAPRIKSGW
jgi:hypothetical protein